ncbi:MAG: response regulator transcription factor [Clostridiales bacterium]|nr:response regulator transcription factor [Clostridiales bacterium]
MDYSILLIDDDRDLHMIISDMLTGYGYKVSSAASAEEAFELLSKNTYHLLLLDINLPDSDGFALCKALRKVSTVPVIFASARTSEDDRISGYEIGGDDYLPKPYSMKELLAHVQALLRRTYGFSEEERILTFGNVTVNMTARTVTRKGEPVSLSLREFDLLAFLCEHKNQAMPKDKILTSVWGAFMTSEASTLTVHIRWLREKLEDDPADPKYIKTVYKVGYMLEVPEDVKEGSEGAKDA